jgi:hypothetical protein
MLTPGPNIERPPDAMHRIIYSIYVELEPPAGDASGAYEALCVPLKRDGMPGGNPSSSNGRPRPPKRRTIDLRVGDQILCMGRWRTIKSIVAYRDGWLTEQAAESSQVVDGYVYRLSTESPATQNSQERKT